MAYNGWSNYETWNVKLWLDNDEGTYRHWTDEAERLVRDEDDRDDATGALAKLLEAEIRDEAPELSGTYSDLLLAALGGVSWYEIAEAMIGDVEVEDEDEAEGGAA